jgi:7,8-dihydropterin-6-yl-methyl-4-(beta-D-ribofuranosyl)aminobenzene 5'-phosphate synthase
MFKLYTLIENTVNDSTFHCEHGLSFWLEYDDNRVLFDTGKSGLFLENAKTLGIDISSTTALVISHGHYDHSGGVPDLLEHTDFSAPAWVGEGFFERKVSLDDAGPRYNGNPFSPELFASKGIAVHTIDGRKDSPVSIKLAKGLYILAGFPRKHSEETIPPRLVLEHGKRTERDPFSDEICIVADLGSSVAVIVGCSHPGIMNILDTVLDVFKKPIHSVYGGSHLYEADRKRIETTTRYLAKNEIQIAAFGHCTGEEATTFMQKHLHSWQRLYSGALFIA